MRKQRMKWRAWVFVPGTIGVLLFIAFVLSLRAANAQSRNTLECPAVIEERSLPENSFINSIETDGYTATIEYTTSGGTTEVLTLQFIDWEAASWVNPHPYFSHGQLQGKLDEVPFSFASLEGKCLKEAIFTYNACLYNAGWGPWMVLWDQWTFLAKRCENGGGGGNGGNGGQQTAKPVQFEGFIQSIAAVADALEVTVGKEGNFVTLIVDSQTTITVNGQSAGLGDLQNGDKAKGKYDSSNNHALQLLVER